MKLVLVDIDGTLVRAPSSERRFARHLKERGSLSPAAWLSFALFAIRYLPRFGGGVLRKNKAYLAGMRVEDVDALADEFVSERLVHAFFEPACARVRRHLQAGDDVWLLSGTLSSIARRVAQELRLDKVIATECAVTDGRIAARPPVQHPYGADKLELARELADARGLMLSEATAYADSWADRELLEAVGTAVAVMPDSKLAAHAARQGWEVLSSDDGDTGSTRRRVARRRA